MAVVGEDEPASETPCAARVRAVLRIEEPIIRAERPVKPQGMIEAGDLEAVSKTEWPCAPSATSSRVMSER